MSLRILSNPDLDATCSVWGGVLKDFGRKFNNSRYSGNLLSVALITAIKQKDHRD
jgi:hypothetical protein